MDSLPLLSTSRSPPACVCRGGREHPCRLPGARRLQGRPAADLTVRRSVLGCGLARAEIFSTRLPISEFSPPRIKPGTQETLEKPLLPSDRSQVGGGYAKPRKARRVHMNVSRFVAMPWEERISNEVPFSSVCGGSAVFF